MRLIDIMMTDLDITIAPSIKERAKEIIVAGLTADSRRVRPGYLFAALPGAKTDGHQYIVDAINNGAVSVLALPGTKLPNNAGGVQLIEDPNPRRRFSKMAAKFYGRQSETICAVTGTNGKTSTVKFAQQLWQKLEYSSASLGTMGVDAPQINWPEGMKTVGPTLTTPDSETLHKEVAELAIGGVTHLAVEASSHGLDQYRLDGLNIKVGAFTNLTRDHLDYHGSMGAYFNAKARLFTEVLANGSSAVINADIPESESLIDLCKQHKHRVIDYGFNAKSIRIVSLKPTLHGQNLELNVFGHDYKIDFPLIGQFQVMNALCALGMVLACEKDESRYASIIGFLAELQGVHGRMELVERLPNGAPVYIDYAHTPDGLTRVLEGLRPHTGDRLIVAFGCGGDRDKGKRPIMGEIASRMADKVIITDDNPRTENPKRIREEILNGCPEAIVIGDRRKAIEKGISMLQPKDILLVAGKGHEQGQIIDKIVHPFDDAIEVRKAIKKVCK